MWIGFVIFFVGMGGWFADEQIEPCKYQYSSAYQANHCDQKEEQKHDQLDQH